MRTLPRLLLVAAVSIAAACERSPVTLDEAHAPSGPIRTAFLPIPTTTDDAWDVSNGATVDATSGTLSNFLWPPENIFGKVSSGQTVTNFRDGLAAGSVHWVEWSVPAPVSIERFDLTAVHDGHITAGPAPRCPLPAPYAFHRDANHRGFDRFVLKAWNANTAAFDIVLYDAAIPLGDDDDVHPGEGAELYDPDALYSNERRWLVLQSAIPLVETDRWRAEFTQKGCPSSESGPRVLELDGFVSEVIEVAIDVKPGDDPNAIQCDSPGNGVIPVAILTTGDFDALTVDHATVLFAGAAETHEKDGEAKRHEEDVDGDGDVDLVLHVRRNETDLDCDSTEATLTGETFDGEAIGGTAPVTMVGGS